MSKGKSRFAGLEIGDPAPMQPGSGAVMRDAAYYLAAALDRELAGEHDKALTHYSAALGEDPLCIEAWTRQLWMLLYLDETPEASIWADKALQSFPADPDILSLKSLAQWRNGLREEARNLNDHALAATRGSANVWLTRGEMQLDADMKSAAACFRRAADSPGIPGMADLRAGDIYLRCGKFAEAAEHYRKATCSIPESAWAWYGYGRAQRALGKAREARNCFARAGNLAPRDERYRKAAKAKPGWFGRIREWLRGGA
ncbi:MAG: tetratricopeptide repeat protein [Planctomycetota bacterium]|jgi:tetratricopeptide (TPR) repeat protein|nr:tetratricopeptide repeat protein [Planctomycetota bacterium]